jgi:hypothetical protein
LPPRSPISSGSRTPSEREQNELPTARRSSSQSTSSLKPKR